MGLWSVSAFGHVKTAANCVKRAFDSAMHAVGYVMSGFGMLAEDHVMAAVDFVEAAYCSQADSSHLVSVIAWSPPFSHCPDQQMGHPNFDPFLLQLSLFLFPQMAVVGVLWSVHGNPEVG